jgi:hypothetical protein
MGITIVIIDQGVDASHERLNGCYIDGVTIERCCTGGVATERGREDYQLYEHVYSDDTGHGTGIAAIIYRMAPEARLFALKLAAEDRRITEDLLVKALEYCLDMEGVQVINISMGIAMAAPSERLSTACRRVAEKGILISAAAYNFPGLACYPAHLPSVYGVSIGLVKDKREYGYQEGPINILAKGTTQRVATLNNGYSIAQGTSYATAYFTAIAAGIISRSPGGSLEEIREAIRREARKDVQPLYYFKQDAPMRVHLRTMPELDVLGRELFTGRERIAFAGRVALFPVSEKEMKTVLEFSGECRTEVTMLIDYPVRLNHSELAQAGGLGLDMVRDVEKVDFSLFDTLVCGYFLDQLSDANVAFGIRLVERCIALNKHFILWDEDVYELVKKMARVDYSGRIHVVRVDDQLYEEIKQFHNLPYLKVPVLGVVGTSNRQGKITAQMRIRDILRSAGYKVAHVSTEPQGILLGADFVFPYGFKTPIHPPEPEWSRLMRIAMRGIQRYAEPDIILTGTQGGLLPRAKMISNELGHDLSSMHYLLGVQPDAIACAINPMDPPELVRQTVGVIASYCKSKLVFCFLTPWTRNIYTDGSGQKHFTKWALLDRVQMTDKLRYYEDELLVPVIDMMDKDKDAFILQAIQDTFS